jgi:hypothetical protein
LFAVKELHGRFLELAEAAPHWLTIAVRPRNECDSRARRSAGITHKKSLEINAL